MATHSILGSRIRQMRERHCWSQAELAELLATSIPSISRWEHGIALPSPYYRRKLCGLFTCTPEELGFLAAEAHPASHSTEQAELFGDRLAAVYSDVPAAMAIATAFPLPHAVRLIGRDEAGDRGWGIAYQAQICYNVTNESYVT